MAASFKKFVKVFLGMELLVLGMAGTDRVCLPYFEQAFQSQTESQQQSWYSGMVTNQEIVTMSQSQKTMSDVSTGYFFP